MSESASLSDQTNLAQSSKEPQLPIGNANLLRGITENFSFHASPEAFIASRVKAWQNQNESTAANLTSRTPVRAKILNRNVAIISSFHQIQTILGYSTSQTVTNDGDNQPFPPFIASKAYDELMTQFFPPPNLLLSDGSAHIEKRLEWEKKIADFCSAQFTTENLSTLISTFFKTEVPLDTEVDLYDLMKTLAWRILFGAFLNLSLDNPDQAKMYRKIQGLQEDLLRGQFSLMPVSINTRFWQSPRSRGIAARKELQEILSKILKGQISGENNRLDVDKLPNNGICPAFQAGSIEGTDLQEIRDHLLMMTSSLAAKGLASLLTAFLLNLFLFEKDGKMLVDGLLHEPHGENRRMTMLKNVYLETERLSPPIVGIMRRLTRDVVIEGWNGENDTLLPNGWDVWMYFVGAGRDISVFGPDCESFDPTRYDDFVTPQSVSFGAGSKSCLGKRFMQAVVLLVAESCLASGLRIQGKIVKPGVRAWLGWDVAEPEKWASDMKQLPTQRPAAPVLVHFVKDPDLTHPRGDMITM